MLARFRETLTLALITLLPFHALFVTFGTKFLLGQRHPPMQALALWKEGLLGIILLMAVVEILFHREKRIDKREKRSFLFSLFSFNFADLLILALLAISAFLFWYRPWMTTTGFLLGFKYDFIPLIAFMVLRRVQWSDWFRIQAEHLLLIVGGLVALYGILTVFAPWGFFRLLGYSDAVSLYLPSGPIAAFQQISGSALRRMQSTMSGPNQLGLWLLIPWTICMLRMTSEKLTLRQAQGKNEKLFSIIHYSLFILFGLSLLLTFSRSAWIAVFVIGVVIGWKTLPKRVFRDAFVGVVSLLVIAGVAASFIAPSVFVRATSTREHIIRPLKAINEMIRYPLGMGLGAAGPAANRTHEPCVFLEPGSDPSWAKNSPRLCVFVGKMQVQPVDHGCGCALLPENWYLQIGVELGFAGMLIYLTLIGMVLWRLRKTDVAFLVFLGISIAALFLHAWEDAAVAYTAWVMVAFISSRDAV